jgi:hypothetical protein
MDLVQFVGYWIWDFLALTWWFWAFFILWPLFRSMWIYWRNEVWEAGFENDFRPILLEIHIPREIRRNPMAMEQVLMGIHQLRNTANDLHERWWLGERTKWFSLEIASFGGEIHFYIRTHFKLKPLVEASFYSNYPDLELVEVDDYVSRFPKDIHEMRSQGYDLWGGEMMLAKVSAYPIKWYPEFESPDEDKSYDPMSQFLEVLSKIKREEIVAIQIIISPALDEWADDYHKLVEKLKETKYGSSADTKKVGTVTEFPGGPLPALSPVSSADDPFGKLSKRFMARTPGETDVLEGIEENISQPAFRTVIRFIYFSPTAMLYDSFPRRGLASAFNQYATLDLNRFMINYPVSTRTKIWQKPFIFPKLRNEYRKQRILDYFKRRRIPPERLVGKFITSFFLNWNFNSKEFELSVRSLATLYHPPMYVTLTAPHIQRIESRKVAPPAGLAIYGGEEEIERFR